VARPRVIVVGSVNTDLVVVTDRLPAAGETVTGGEFSRHGGGKGANQAVAAARLGAQVTMVGAVGRDPFGDEALELLEREGIDTAAVARAEAPTGVALINVDAAGENQIAVAPGANEALDPDAVERAVRSAGPGVVLLSQEVSEAAVLAGARAAAGPIVLNPAPCPTSSRRSALSSRPTRARPARSPARTTPRPPPARSPSAPAHPRSSRSARRESEPQEKCQTPFLHAPRP
jgi:ribokinase